MARTHNFRIVESFKPIKSVIIKDTEPKSILEKSNGLKKTKKGNNIKDKIK